MRARRSSPWGPCALREKPSHNYVGSSSRHRARVCRNRCPTSPRSKAAVPSRPCSHGTACRADGMSFRSLDSGWPLRGSSKGSSLSTSSRSRTGCSASICSRVTSPRSRRSLPRHREPTALCVDCRVVRASRWWSVNSQPAGNHLRRCVRTLCDLQPAPLEIVVVDNAPALTSPRVKSSPDSAGPVRRGNQARIVVGPQSRHPRVPRRCDRLRGRRRDGRQAVGRSAAGGVRREPGGRGGDRAGLSERAGNAGPGTVRGPRWLRPRLRAEIRFILPVVAGGSIGGRARPAGSGPAPTWRSAARSSNGWASSPRSSAPAPLPRVAKMEMLYRVIKHGIPVVYEPRALAWHRHRREPSAGPSDPRWGVGIWRT